MKVRDDVIISHRGARYEIGRGPGCYAIWPAGGAHLQPIEWWPETEAGWQDAWARFTDIERRRSISEVQSAGSPAEPALLAAEHATSPDAAVPDAAAEAAAPEGPADPAGEGSIPAWAAAGLSDATGPAAYRRGAASRPTGLAARRGARAMTAAALLTLGVILGIAGLFPGYFGNSSLASQSSELVPHLIYLAAWAAAAVLIAIGGARQRAGALLAAGTSIVTLGLFIADAGTAAAAGTSLIGTGMIISLIGWAVCTAGAVVALVRGGAGLPARPRGADTVVHMVLGLTAAIGAAIAFVPSWDRYTLDTPAGASQSITEGYAFANPGLVIAGDVLVMLALVAVVLVATLWRPVRFGAALVAGASVPMVAQAVSAMIQIRGSVSPLQFGLTPSQAARIGLHISSGLTPAFWIYCVFVLGLLLTWSLMLATPAQAPPAPRPQPAHSPADSGPLDAPATSAG
jgi:uncharacterized membrane protein YagU involved in acid resistance